MSKRLVDLHKIVQALPCTTPSTSTPQYVSLKNFSHLTAIIDVKNSTTVTGSAITLKQATAIAGTSEKALSFDIVHANTDTAATDTLVSTAVSSDTFTTSTTNSKKLQYVIEVPVENLDVANGFDCIRVGTGDAANTTVNVTYILSGARYPQATGPSAILD